MTSNCVARVWIWKRDWPNRLAVGWLAGLVLGCPVTLAGDYAAELTASLDACIQQHAAAAAQSAEPEPAVRCPALTAALARHGVTPWLQPAPADEFTLSQVSDLQHLIQPAAQAERSRTLNYTGLDAILQDTLLTDAKQTEEGWWQRFLAWLEKQLDQRNEADYSRLKDWIQALKPSQQVARFIVYGSLLLIVVLAVVIIVNEIRAAGGSWRFRRRVKQTRARLSETGQAHSSPLLPASIRSLPPAQQPAALLKACLQHLMDSGQIPTARSHTNREFWRLLRTVRNPLAEPFGRLAEAVERTLYGGQAIAAAELVQCYQDAGALLQPLPLAR